MISKAAIRTFSRNHPDALAPLMHGFYVAKHAKWCGAADVRSDFAHADFVGDRTVFNIAGNKYRLVAAIKYRWQVVYVRHILTHAEYDEGDWEE